MQYKCKKCGETENLHYNYDYSKQHRPILNAVCNECGNLIGVEFNPELTVDEILDLMAKQNQELGLYDPPYVSDDFQIGPDGAYEHTEDFQTKPGFVERRMKLGKAINDRDWDEIYTSYTGVSDLHDFVEWLKQNYIAPEKI